MSHYQKTMQNVLNEIESNLEYIEIDDLIKLSGYSYYHFHRIFLGFTGESLKRYIRRIRLQKSAYMLQKKKGSITDIAMQSGYNTPSSYNKAFKEMFNCAPSEFVKQIINKRDFKMLEPVRIETINSIEVYALRHVGDYLKCYDTWDKLVQFAWNNSLNCKEMRSFGIVYDDPDVVETSKLRYDACVSKTKEVELKNGVELKQIEGGKYAIFLHKGSYESLIETYTAVFGSWVQENNVELRDAPPIEEYIVADVKPEDLRTELWVPIK